MGEVEQPDMWMSSTLRGTEMDIASPSGRERSEDELLRVRWESDLDLMGIDRDAEEIEALLLARSRSSSMRSSISSVKGAKFVRLGGSSGMIWLRGTGERWKKASLPLVVELASVPSSL